MPSNCPHCDGDVQAVIDPIIKQRLKTKSKQLEAAHTTRLEGQRREIELLERRVGELTEASSGLGAMEEELRTLRATVQTSSRTEALRANGLPVELLGDIQTLFDSRQASKDEADRSTFEDFLGVDGEARSMVLLAHHFAAEQTGAVEGSSTVAPARQPSGLPNANGGALNQSTRAARLSPAQARDYFRSPAFRSMSTADQRAKLAEVKAQVAAERSGAGIP
jgi:hypothetical protein